MKIQKFQGSGKIAKLAKAVTPAVRTTRRTISKTPIRARIPQSDYNVTNQAIGYYLTGDPQNRFQLVKDIDLTAGQSNGETLFKIDQDTLTGDEIQQMIDQAIKTPETKNDIVKFSGTPIDTSDPIQRQLLIREYQRKYPNFSLYPKEREITTGGDEYYEIGKFPYDAAV